MRRHLGHTPKSFAAALGMSKAAYLPYEKKGQRGERGWTAMVPRIVYLGLPRPVSLNWLFTGEEYPGAERNDDLPLFLFPDGVGRSIRPRRRPNRTGLFLYRGEAHPWYKVGPETRFAK